MCKYMYKYIHILYIYIYANVCVYIYICIFKCVYIYIYVYVHTNIYYIVYINISLSFFRPPEAIQTDCGPKRAWENNQELIIQKVQNSSNSTYTFSFILQEELHGIALCNQKPVFVSKVLHSKLGKMVVPPLCWSSSFATRFGVKILAPVCGRMP